jgi:hypothetical protein
MRFSTCTFHIQYTCTVHVLFIAETTQGVLYVIFLLMMLNKYSFVYKILAVISFFLQLWPFIKKIANM